MTPVVASEVTQRCLSIGGPGTGLMNGSCWSDLPMVGYKGNKVFVCFAKFGECELYLGYLQFPSGHDMSLGTIFLRWLLNEFVLTEHEMEPQPLLNAIGYRG